MTFRFRSLFATAYSHGEAAAENAPLHTAFSTHFDIFFYRGVAAIIYTFQLPLFLFFIFGFDRFLLRTSSFSSLGISRTLSLSFFSLGHCGVSSYYLASDRLQVPKMDVYDSTSAKYTRVAPAGN